MSSSVFRQIAAGGRGAAKAERLFHAAISAFCSLTRPSRGEVAQLNDLTLPLFEHVSPASRRFAAAALSECDHAPAGLVHRLCQESVDVAAPLLVRSPVLSDIDLVALIGRHGLAHAQAIARRPNLHPAIADLIRALTRDADMQRPSSAVVHMPPDVALPSSAPASESSMHGVAAENARRRLRGMMRGAPDAALPPVVSARLHFARLRDAALGGYAPFFETALADALNLRVEAARQILGGPRAEFTLALHAAGLKPEEAFLIAAAMRPATAAGTTAINAFLDEYRALTTDVSAAALNRWRRPALGAEEGLAGPLWLRQA